MRLVEEMKAKRDERLPMVLTYEDVVELLAVLDPPVVAEPPAAVVEPVAEEAPKKGKRSK